MDKKLHTLSLLFFLAGLSIFAQSDDLPYDLQWGPLQKGHSKDLYEGVVSGDTNGIYVLRSKYTTLGDHFFYLDFFSGDKYTKVHTAELVGKDTYKGTIAKYRTYFENIFMLNGRLVLFLSSYDHEKDKFYAYAQYLNDAGDPVGELKQVAEIDASRKSNRGSYYFTSSSDQTKILIVAYNPITQRYNDEKFEVSLLDTALNNIWSHTYVLPYKDQDFMPLDFKVSNEGNVYMLSKVYMSKTQQMEKKLDKAEYYFTLLHLNPENADADYHETVFQLDDKYIINMIFRFDRENKVRLSGFYSLRREMNKYKGIYSITFPEGKSELEKISLYDFDDDFVPDFQTESPMKFNEDGEPELQLLYYIILPDGGTLLVSEYAMISEICFTDIRTALTTCNYSYYYNDIFIVKSDPDGKVSWKIRIPKRQVTRNDNGIYSSFAMGLLDEKIVLLYNENPRNLKIKGSNAFSFMTEPFKSTVVAVEIDKNGHARKYELFSNLKKRVCFKPQLYYQYNRESLILFSQKNRIYQFGELSR